MTVGLVLETSTIGLDLATTALGVTVDQSGNPVGIDIRSQSSLSFAVVTRTGSGGSTTLLGLTDVDAPSFDVGDVPVWDGTKFEGEPPGAASVDRTYTAGVNLSGHQWVTLNSAGEAIPADSQVGSHAGRTVGMTIGAATSGDPVIVRPFGELVEPSWTWTPDAPVFVGHTGPTQTQPSAGSGDAFSQIAGWAVDATTIEITPQFDPIIL